MKKHEAEKLIAVIRELAEDGVGRPEPAKATLDRPHQPYNADQKAEIARIGEAGKAPAAADVDFEVLYQKIYTRAKRQLLTELQVDPVFVKLLASVPEIMLEIEPRQIDMKATSLKGRIARLAASKFFEGGKLMADIKRELLRTGSDPGGNLSGALSDLVLEGFLTREADGVYNLAPGVKVTEKVLEAR